MIKRTSTTRSKVQGKAQANQKNWLAHVATLTEDDLLLELNAHDDGLSDAEVETNRALWGENVFSKNERPSLPKRILKSFADPFTYILAVIAVISVATDWIFASAGTRDLTTPLIIGVMILVSAALRLYQDERSSEAADALESMIETTCSVERAGAGIVVLPVDEVVVGDIVRLSSGDVVPADLRLVNARDLFVSQSALTGESDSVEKRPVLTVEDGASVAVTDLDDIAFQGSTVISGTGAGVVVATGTRTLMGEATDAVANGGARQTAFDEGIGSTSRLLMRLMAFMLPAVFLIGGITKGNWIDALLFSLSVAVGLTPEMLPVLVTSCLGKGSVDLSHDKVIVKRLDAIQDLGAIDMLCTDKTGTLTEDRVVLERHLNIQGEEDEGVLVAGFMNSFFQTGLRNLIDSAIIRRTVEILGETADELSGEWHMVDELPFDFERRRMSVVVGNSQGETRMICKGALEELLDICDTALLDGTEVPLDEDLMAVVAERGQALADKGMRVLGVARRDNPAGVNKLTPEDERGMVLLGYLAFLDPPKESSAKAIAALAEHGVTTKVLTGDSGRVAAYVCEKIGIPVTGVLTGADVEAMDDDQLAACVEETTVFAKLAPAQKARVVTKLRELGHAVGYMGDGVNDAPAMRASDCGISVDSAVDVAREAADILLLEKDLMVLEHGIEIGRATYANMIKYVKLTVSANFGNIFSVLIAATLLPFLPMTAVQMLLLNLIYDITCTAIPWDGVDDEFVRDPRRWDTRSIQEFMLRMGPVSSVFDVLTFLGLFFWICPMVAGGAWGTLDAAGQTAFACAFQAGWFIESMWTQTLAVHLIRTGRVPFVESRASNGLLALGVVGIALATLLPFSPLAEGLDFVALPAAYFGLLALAVVGYSVCLTIAKRLYLRRHDSLL